jgi:hypothetical protein
MTPKEKAEALVKEFGEMESTTYHDGYADTTSIESIYLSKKCATKCVNEILELLPEIAFGNRVIEFYEQVKNEIEKL